MCRCLFQGSCIGAMTPLRNVHKGGYPQYIRGPASYTPQLASLPSCSGHQWLQRESDMGKSFGFGHAQMVYAYHSLSLRPCLHLRKLDGAPPAQIQASLVPFPLTVLALCSHTLGLLLLVGGSARCAQRVLPVNEFQAEGT